jgi:hypothetical protein
MGGGGIRSEKMRVNWQVYCLRGHSQARFSSGPDNKLGLVLLREQRVDASQLIKGRSENFKKVLTVHCLGLIDALNACAAPACL